MRAGTKTPAIAELALPCQDKLTGIHRTAIAYKRRVPAPTDDASVALIIESILIVQTARMKIVLWIVLIIFLIGLAVVLGIGKLIF